MNVSPTTDNKNKVGQLDAAPPSPTRVFDHHLRHAAQLESPVSSPTKMVYDHHQRHAAMLESPVSKSPKSAKKVYDHHQRHAAQLESPVSSPKRSSQEQEQHELPPTPPSPPPAVYDVGFHLAYSSPKTKKTKSQQQVEDHKRVIQEILKYGQTPTSSYEQKVLKEVSDDIARIQQTQIEHHNGLQYPPMAPDLDGWMDDDEDMKAKEEYHQDVVKAILAVAGPPQAAEGQQKQQPQNKSFDAEAPSDEEEERVVSPPPPTTAQQQQQHRRRHSSPMTTHKKKPLETDICIPDDSIEFEVEHHKRVSSLLNVQDAVPEEVPEEEDDEAEAVVRGSKKKIYNSSPRSARDKFRAKKIAEYDIFEPTEAVLSKALEVKSPKPIKPSHVKKHSLLQRMFHRS